MIDLGVINQAIFDALKQVAPENFRFVLLMWDDDDTAVSSNEMNIATVRNALLSGAKIVADSKPQDYIFNGGGMVGNA